MPIRARLVLLVRTAYVFTGALPWTLPLLRHVWPSAPPLLLLDLSFGAICHRRPERTLSIADIPMPLCSRCAGIFAGLALGALVARPVLSASAARRSLAVAAVLMLADVVTQDLGLHPLWHATRLATGGVLGWLLACALVSLVRREQQLENQAPSSA